jgi:hypothetical protein
MICLTGIVVLVCYLFQLMKLHFKTSVDANWQYDRITPSVSDAENNKTPIIQKPSSQQSPPYAYVFMIAGVSEQGYHRGYVYNAIVTRYCLNESTSHVIVMVRIAATSNMTALAESDISLLTTAGIQIKYLPKLQEDSFYNAMMDKFEVLRLTQYRRVIFFDGDAFPLCNMDYVFHLSDPLVTDPPILQENMVHSFINEPAQGGFFMLAPKPGDYAELQAIIDAQESNVTSRDHVFDPIQGWGHVIEDDGWIDLQGRKHMTWDMHGAMADQGLLWHWVKYVKQHVSVFLGNTLSSFGPHVVNGKRQVHLLDVRDDALRDYVCFGQHMNHRAYKYSGAPTHDMHHFTGNRKPWIVDNETWLPITANMSDDEQERVLAAAESHNARKFWLIRLARAKLKWNLDIAVLKVHVPKNMLGHTPTKYAKWSDIVRKRNEEQHKSTTKQRL